MPERRETPSSKLEYSLHEPSIFVLMHMALFEMIVIQQPPLAGGPRILPQMGRSRGANRANLGSAPGEAEHP